MEVVGSHRERHASFSNEVILIHAFPSISHTHTVEHTDTHARTLIAQKHCEAFHKSTVMKPLIIEASYYIRPHSHLANF